MRELGISCDVCTWYDDDKEELNEFWCMYDPDPVPTLPYRYCSRFRCVCGGDLDDGMDHLDCLELEFEVE
jgi:hypothetical protein